MSNYTQIIKQLLERQYSDKQCISIVVSTLNLKFIPPKAQILLQTYSQLKTLTLTNCDLRKLQNFPLLPHLQELDLSNNSLQGTFNYLMPLKSLTYLNIAGNLIADYRVLEPLRRLKRLEVYLKDNPFTEASNWKYKIRLYSLIILKQPRSVDCLQQKVQEFAKEEVDEQMQRQLQRRDRKVFNFGSFRDKMMSNLQRSLIDHPQPQPQSQPNFPPQMTIQLDEMNPVELLPLNDSPYIFDNSPFINDLQIEIANQHQLQEGVDFESENFDANDSDDDGEEDEPDAPYF